MVTDGGKLDITLPYLIDKYNLNESMVHYQSLLAEENKKINLVSRETIDKGMIELVADSLIPFEKVDGLTCKRYLDIGTGGGLPLVPIIISFPVQEITFIERRQKKAAAVSRILVGLSKQAEKFAETFENYKTDKKYDLITLRLVKLTPKILKMIVKLLSPDGHFIYYFTPEFDSKIDHISGVRYCYSLSSKNTTKSFTIFKKVK